MRSIFFLSFALASISFSSHAFSEQTSCTAEELNAKSSAQVAITKEADFSLLSKALNKANRKGYEGGSYKVAVQHDRTGQIVGATLDRTTGYEFLDKAISAYMHSYQVSPGFCGRTVIPLALHIPE